MTKNYPIRNANPEKPPRCPAGWVAGGDGTIKDKRGHDRSCGRFATEVCDVGGREVEYCPAHADDRRKANALEKKLEKTRRELHDRRWHLADEFTAKLPELASGTPSVARSALPKDVTIVYAVKCTCGEVFARAQFPDHYADCDGDS